MHRYLNFGIPEEDIRRTMEGASWDNYRSSFRRMPSASSETAKEALEAGGTADALVRFVEDRYALISGAALLSVISAASKHPI